MYCIVCSRLQYLSLYKGHRTALSGKRFSTALGLRRLSSLNTLSDCQEPDPSGAFRPTMGHDGLKYPFSRYRGSTAIRL